MLHDISSRYDFVQRKAKYQFEMTGRLIVLTRPYIRSLQISTWNICEIHRTINVVWRFPAY